MTDSKKKRLCPFDDGGEQRLVAQRAGANPDAAKGRCPRGVEWHGEGDDDA